MAEKRYKTIDGKRYYRQGFAIMGEADKPETWKLPHHVSGDRPHDELGVDWGRVEAALVAVESGQFRGNALDASLEERKKAGRHLAAHYRRADKEVPEGLRAFLAGKKERAMARRKIGRGKALTELVKGSLDYTINEIVQAFGAAFVPSGDWLPRVVEVFADYVVVWDAALATGEYYRVGYERREGEYVFTPRGEWEVVELTYQPQTVTESRRGATHADRSGRDVHRTSDKGGTGKGPAEAGTTSEARRSAGRRFEERVVQAVRLEEAVAGQPRYINGIGITADVVNGNGRRYPSAVLREAVQEMTDHLNESAGQGRLGVVSESIAGEAEHPSDKGQRPRFLETIVKWEEVRFDEGDRRVKIRGRMLETSQGRDAIAIMEAGVLPAISLRGYGDSQTVKADGVSIEEVTWLTITGFDLVAPGEQSDPNAGIGLFEAVERHGKGVGEVDFEELLQKLKEEGLFEELARDIQGRIEAAEEQRDEERRMRALREALGAEAGEDLVEAARRLAAREPERVEPGELEASLRAELGLNDTDDLQEALAQREARRQELEEAERKRKLEAYIREQVESLNYPDWLREQMAEAVRALEPKGIEEAKAAIAGRRKEYDAIMAKVELAAQGHPSALRVLGPVIERDAGVPEYARGAFEITESMVRRDLAIRWDPRQPETPNQRFAAAYLEKFDKVYRHHLIQEARMLAEAEQTSDLNIPYSITRAVVAEAFPRLVATSIFDVGMTDQQTARVYYEAYSGETGETVTVTNEDVTSDEGAWVDLDYKRVLPGTVVAGPDGVGTGYTEGTDFVIDYANGRFFTLAAGSIGDATAMDVDYQYYAYRLGEMAAIERGKGSLSYTTLTMAADRLATEISTEAVLFSRSQIGWDATARTLAMLVRQIQRRIDQGLLYLALASALKVASNSGGTWTAATDPIANLVEYIGAARVLVANRYYEPTAVIMSVTNSDRAANWDGFTAAGSRPDAMLNATGYVGRLKGLPCFESTEMSDSYVVVCNRECVIHRVYQPMQLKGPYPSYSSNKLYPSEQYYAEEFNGSDAPVDGKAAYVTVS